MDTDPAKVALGLVKMIIEIKDVRHYSSCSALTHCYPQSVKDNRDAVARQIVSTGDQLKAIQEALGSWGQENKKEEPWMRQFKMYDLQSYEHETDLTIEQGPRRRPQEAQ